MAGFWTELPAGRVVRLTGASPEAILSALEPLPDDAPAVVHCRHQAETSSAGTVAAILDRLEVAALDLYPAWLPGADAIEAPGGAGVPAVRALALQQAATTPHFGPFLADLAARSLSGSSTRFHRFPPEVRAAGLARVIADSYRRGGLVLLVQPPDSLAPAEEAVLVTACEWLTHHGGLSVWLTSGAGRTFDRVLVIDIGVPDSLAEPLARNVSESHPEPAVTVVRLPALAGEPHPASRSERALEAALARLPWATGRVWNRSFQPDPLANPIRVDLMWPDERCAVEIDGAEHRGVQHYEDDRRRDVSLQLAGYAVLRYTNVQIQRDISAVLAQLEQFITNRRPRRDRHGH
jgi:very-short-patch-repair endonuclease